ncbi:hypothetical protein AB6A23_00860 [Paenibacillus tarimensis]
MSEFIAFCKEKLAVDELLDGGYTIAGISEDLDGTMVRFLNPAVSPDGTELRLLNAEARKYVVAILFQIQESTNAAN